MTRPFKQAENENSAIKGFAAQLQCFSLRSVTLTRYDGITAHRNYALWSKVVMSGK